MARLSKSKILSGLQCPKRLYLEVLHPELREVGAGAEQRFRIGSQVGEVARQSMPGGHLIGQDGGLGRALAETREFLKREADRPLFEATFEHGGVLVQMDLLQPQDGGHLLYEVKSSTRVKQYYLPDCAVQAWVGQGAGLNLKEVHLMHVENTFVYQGGGSYEGLFTSENLTADISSLIADMPDTVAACKDIVAGDCPDIEPGPQCKDPFECPFMGYCVPPTDGFPVALLPRGRSVAERLVERGIEDIRDIPPGELASALHERIRRVTTSGKRELDAELMQWIQRLPWPRYFMDFETIQFAVPVWEGTRPYEQLPFQWSCHIQLADGELRHEEFLSTDGAPPMRAFASTLLSTLGSSGPILVYSHFEKGVLSKLMELFPDLADELNGVIERLVDLLPPTRAHYYHPDMRGSFSIKAVLPTVAPDFDYTSLDEVSEGGEAQMAYLEIIDPQTDASRKLALEKALRRYCALDTEAMVRMNEYFAAGPCPAGN